MFTENEKSLILYALLVYKTSLERSKAKAKNPRFGPIYDEDIGRLASVTMKVQALEVSDGKGKVPSRP